MERDQITLQKPTIPTATTETKADPKEANTKEQTADQQATKPTQPQADEPKVQTADPQTDQQTEHQKDEYLRTRVFDQMHLTRADCQITLRADGGDDIHTSTSTWDIFTADDKGNIRILVYKLSGWVVQYPDPSRGKSYDHCDITRLCTYYVTRIAPWNLRPDGGKYVFPKGQGTYPFFPPALMQKYANKTPIDTLILTEGYFKAMCASKCGFDIVGLGSVTLYKDSSTHEFYPDIKLLINTCKVKKVVLLYDGDCLNISEKDLQAKRDLARRPLSFYNSIINTRDLLVDFSDVQIEFAYIKSDALIDHPKGLDDLLLTPAYHDHHSDILLDLTSSAINGQYFFRMNVRDQVKRLRKHFFLDSVNSFYLHWQDKIGENDFVYEHMIYHYDAKTEKVERTMPLEIQNFIRVGDDYFEMIKRPVIRTGGEELALVPRLKSTIIDDFGRDQLKNIRKFKAFANVPSHIDYKPVVGDCFNLYHPIHYHAEHGRDWSHIRALMTHIFGEQLELGYDYMQLLYLRPMQILPILCLVSHERGTGKTSFLDLLREIYGSNAVVVGNSEIASEFNAIVSGKLIVGVDETSLEDNVKVTERLKMLSTAKTAPMQRKGKDHEIVENFTKYILCSNNETRFIFTQEDEVRFWVRKIDPIPQDELIPDILPIIADEIPGFLAFLMGRRLSIPDAKTRMWFAPSDIVTDALLALKAAQQPLSVREIREAVRNLFLEFPQPEYIISIEVLQLMVPSLQRLSSEIIVGFLKNNLNLEPKRNEDGITKTMRIKIPYHYASGDDISTNYYRGLGKGYIFHAKDFLSPDEQNYLRSLEEHQKAASAPQPTLFNNNNT